MISSWDFYKRIYDGHLQTIANFRATRALFALRNYRAKNGKWPATLSDAMTEVPMDPFDNKPLRYRLCPDGSCVVYSLGRNRKDEGGDPADAMTVDGKDDVYPSNEREMSEEDWQAKEAKKAAIPPTKKPRGTQPVESK